MQAKCGISENDKRCHNCEHYDIHEEISNCITKPDGCWKAAKVCCEEVPE